jgi:diguanylate cyclase (GGDEF)-like protein
VQEQASKDDLTGLHNHRFLVDHISQQVALAERLGSPLALLMLDLDFFKRLNDTYGHAAGDAALRSFATTLKGAIRRSDLAARYGGEEFVVVMPGASQADATMVAEKIRAEVCREPVLLDGMGRSETITVSIGVAAYPENTVAAQDLLRLADAALYRAKDAGRNRVMTSESVAETARPIRLK